MSNHHIIKPSLILSDHLRSPNAIPFFPINKLPQSILAIVSESHCSCQCLHFYSPITPPTYPPYMYMYLRYVMHRGLMDTWFVLACDMETSNSFQQYGFLQIYSIIAYYLFMIYYCIRVCVTQNNSLENAPFIISRKWW